MAVDARPQIQAVGLGSCTGKAGGSGYKPGIVGCGCGIGRQWLERNDWDVILQQWGIDSLRNHRVGEVVSFPKKMIVGKTAALVGESRPRSSPRKLKQAERSR